MSAEGFDPAELSPALWEQVAAAITVLGLEGTILFYNAYAPKILDRKPAYIGRDVCELHKPASAAKIRAMLDAYRQGQAKEFAWQAGRDGQQYAVRLSPLTRGGQICGAVHVAMLLP